MFFYWVYLTNMEIFAIILLLLKGEIRMNFKPNMEGIKGLQLCDYIEIIDMNDDTYIYNVFYSKEFGFCLSSEDEPLIKFLHINDAKLEIYYVKRGVKVMPMEIKTVIVDDHWLFKKNKSFFIEGTLLQYNDEMAKRYKLNNEEYYNKYPKCYGNNVKIRKKVKGE